MQIRIARPTDAKQIAEIYRPYVDYTCYTFEIEAPNEAEFIRRMAEIQSFFPFFVCEEEGRILGYAYAHRFHERAAFGWSCETSVYVDCHVQKKGVGHRLYEALLEALKAQGFAKAYAVLGCPNEPSERFHLREGFVTEGELPNVGFKHGGWHAVLYMGKVLNDMSGELPPPRAFSEIQDERNGKVK